ncbi:UDP-N-acetylglucosamine--N-acetylmuramyl-(pentapeptide) pyrophosphoryl-undecaprenol N-acetylglucosamine transferase [bacterium]|nr:UDP-N-acetylglucosamine--N-acetylmuramyl-(pentapeptide) pyrophosphoryl-undecaprenol N-acetylglucosamine transferase [bacterium]NBX97903.1 UDP-N-acetylglucosamine--N-acetylmuramyl-(pentapeptide) pyrophosphoryl-undecaprenol N-acetylglucosamine transferase [bacterium]NDC93857.1 UDP-N-acetylglucosamine--N-acetylmuramyl-(pentapeptide) pyrophosphoryl-undecaprenol N-acetylglucosamine transferase [bacterium]NDD82804.1 UDP-N-acetylglucosamine--N-acetylmuramyl-(pentapeptide) pyrophosphoryl-undecaprenol
MTKKKIIVMTGGGSGGHLTPVISVAEQLKKVAPDYMLVYIGQTGDGLGDIMSKSGLFNAVHTVRAGKFRRYHGEGLKQLLDVKTLALNLRDSFFVCIGFVQSFRLLRHMRPSVLFCKGGFVGVPVAFAARFLRIPYVTHDSDAIPGLANRLIARGATIHAVALPKEMYNYPFDKTVSVGVPIATKFKHVTEQATSKAKESLHIPHKAQTLLIIGGGLGAERINKVIMADVKKLLDISNLYVFHVVGRSNEEAANAFYDTELSQIDRKRVVVYGFTDRVALLGEAADVVITRAGATNLAEFSAQGKACIIVPNPVLTGGHQLKNAQAYREKQAAIVVSEDHIDELINVAVMLLNNKEKREQLSKNISQFATKDSASLLAGILLAAAEKSQK